MDAIHDSNAVLKATVKDLYQTSGIAESILLIHRVIVVDLRLVRTCATTGQITKKHDLLRVARDIYCTTGYGGHTTSTRLGWF